MKKTIVLFTTVLLLIYAATGVQGAELNNATSYAAESGETITDLGMGYYGIKNESKGTYTVINTYGVKLFETSLYESFKAVSAEGLFAAKDNTEKWALLDESGLLTAFEYDSIDSFSDGLAVVKKTNEAHPSEKYGYIDEMGVLVISCIYSNAYEFSCGVAVVNSYDEDTLEYQYAIIDTSGSVIAITPQDCYVKFRDDMGYYVNNGNDIVIINTKGETIKTISLSGVEYGISTGGIRDGCVLYGTSNDEGYLSWGVISSEEKTIFEPKYAELEFLGDDLFVGRLNRNDTEYTVMDKSGNKLTVLPTPYYSTSENYYCGLETYNDEQYYVVRDKDLNEVIRFPSSTHVNIDDDPNIAAITNENGIYSLVLYSEGIINFPTTETTTESITTVETNTEKATDITETTTAVDAAENENLNRQNPLMVFLAVILIVIIVFCAAVIVALMRYSREKSLQKGLTKLLDDIFKQ